MSDIAIKVENIGKRYRLGVQEERKDTLAATAVSWLRSPLGNYRRLRSLSHFDSNEAGDDVLWALKDVSFEVKRGEVLGIIGRNGAGKSTLLKILSRITPPTRGEVVMNGRVASLLEVGTGFHPELTGRENTYLNGTILGMTKAEIDRKFDEIVDFSGIEKFIDTPVKRYSSGMSVRLAFSVAAHLEPEILLIDEVLAVGDAEFQKKSLGKMEEVSRAGRTVLFVSHNMTSIAQLCTKGLLINNGEIEYTGSAINTIEKYLSSSFDQKKNLEWSNTDQKQPFNDIISIEHYCILNENGLITNGYLSDSKNYKIQIKFRLLQPNHDIRIAFAIYTQEDTLLLASTINDSGMHTLGNLQTGDFICSAPLPINIFSTGTYYIEVLSVIEWGGWPLPRRNSSRNKFTILRDNDPNPYKGRHRLGGLTYPVSPTLDWIVVESSPTTSEPAHL